MDNPTNRQTDKWTNGQLDGVQSVKPSHCGFRTDQFINAVFSFVNLNKFFLVDEILNKDYKEELPCQFYNGFYLHSYVNLQQVYIYRLVRIE